MHFKTQVTGASVSNQFVSDTDLSLLFGLHFVSYQANLVQSYFVFISWITSNKAKSFEASYPTKKTP